MHGVKILAAMKRKNVQLDFRELKNDARAIQKAFRNRRGGKEIELSVAPQRARISDVHKTTRPGATAIRTFEQNQAIAQLRQHQPTWPSSETAISNATTAPPPSALKNLKPLPSLDSAEKRSRGRPPSVSSGLNETPRPVGSARTILIGSIVQDSNFQKIKIKIKMTFKLHVNLKKNLNLIYT